MCMPQFGHCGNEYGPSCRIITWSFQCLYIFVFHSLPGVLALARHPSTRNATELSTRVKYTMYVYLPPPSVSIYQVCTRRLLWMISMWCRSEDAAIVMPHSPKLTLVHLHYQKLASLPIAHHFYAYFSSCPHMRTGVHVMDLVFPRLIYSPIRSSIRTSFVSAPCTQMGFLPAIWTFLA